MKQTSELDPQKKIERGPDGNYSLVGSKCNNCGTVSFLERMVCPACGSYAGHEKVLIGRSGKIHNFTVAHVAPTGYQPPYIVGLIDLAEGPMIFATIEGDPAEAEKLKIGDEVRLAVVETGDPKAENFLRWKYEPVNR